MKTKKVVVYETADGNRYESAIAAEIHQTALHIVDFIYGDYTNVGKVVVEAMEEVVKNFPEVKEIFDGHLQEKE